MLKYCSLNRFFLTHQSNPFSIAKQVEQMHASDPSPLYNITPNILKMVDRKLLTFQCHPLSILTQKIINFYGPQYDVTTSLSPIVTVEDNFDALNIPIDHVSRKPTDTFYINEQHLLRTHTSAHQKSKLQSGLNNFLVFGDVYRRDEIDRFHYPVFHQMEAVAMLGQQTQVSVQDTEKHLKETLEQLGHTLFGDCQMRWVEAYFPFTHPSFELELLFDEKWVEMLGCGIIHQSVLDKAGRGSERGWAAGLGLQRFAMRLFKIPDVRLFWSQNQKFTRQFRKGEITEFKPFSKYPGCVKDISMWVLPEFNENDLFSIIRETGGDLIEAVNLVDVFVDKLSKRTSKAYRINFQSLQRTLTNDQITKHQFEIRRAIAQKLKTVELRGKIVQ